MKSNKLNIIIIIVITVCFCFLMSSVVNSVDVFTSTNNQKLLSGPPDWPTSWILLDTDPDEDGTADDFRDVHYAYYNINDDYLFFRLECYGFPDFTVESEARYKWFIDTNDPHNMGQSGGKVYEAEYLFFLEDTPKPGGDGIGDIYLLEDINDSGFFGDDYTNYQNNPGTITNNSVAGYNIDGHYVDLYLCLANISDSSTLYFTWATDQENPNLDQAPNQDRSNNYWNVYIPKADLSIQKSDHSDPVYSGQYLIYTLNVTNHGPNDANNVKVSDTLPAGVNFYSAEPAPSGGSYPTYWWIFTSIDSGNSEVIAINVTVDSTTSGTIINTAHAINDTRDPIPGNNEDTELTTIIPLAPDITIEKKVWDGTSQQWEDSTTGYLDTDLSFQITVTNMGNVALTNIQVVDNLPNFLTFNNDADYPTSSYSDYHIEWGLGTLGVNENLVITFSVHVNLIGEGNNIANVTTTYDDVSDEDTAHVISIEPPQPGIEIVKEVWDETSQQWRDSIRAPIETNLTFRITVSNIGGLSLHDLIVTDNLSSQLEYRNSANIPPSSESPHQVIWNFCQLNPGEYIEITFNAETIDFCYGWNNVMVTTFEQVSDEDRVPVKVITPGQPIVDIIKEVWDKRSSRWVNFISCNLQADLTFRLIINNTALTTVTNVIISDDLPKQLKYKQDTANIPPSSESPHQVIWNFCQLNPGEKIEITYHAETVNSDCGSNVAIVTALLNNCNLNDTDSVLIDVIDPPIVQLTYPKGGEELSGTETVIKWYALDSEDWGSPYIYLYYSADGGDSWDRIAGSLENNVGDGTHKDRGEYSWDTSKLSDGNYLLKIQAYDSKGNMARDNSDPFTIDNHNTGVLVSYVTVDSSKIYMKNGNFLKIKAGIIGGQCLHLDEITADLSGLGKGSSVPADSFDGLTAIWTVTNVECNPADGSITITVAAGDNSNSATITADNTNPELNVITPDNALYFFNKKLSSLNIPMIIGGLTLDVDVDDSLSGLEKVEFYIDDELKETMTGGLYDWYMNQRLIGSHTLKIVAYDNAGNTDVYEQSMIVFNFRTE